MPLKPGLQQGRDRSMNRWPSRSQRHRATLSVNMISLPLGDFRHLSHVGSKDHQDNFGDLSFLRPGHNLLLQSSKSEQNLLLACAPPPKPPRLNLESPETQDPPDRNVRSQSSRRRKMCSSLPLLDCEEGEEPGSEEAEVGGSTGRDSPRQDSTRRDSTRRDSPRQDSTRWDSTRRDSPRRDSTRRDSTRRDSTRRDSTRRDSTRRDSTGQGSVSSGGDEDSFRAKMEEVLPEADDSIFSLDLGPSILDDVLRVMDRFH